MMRRGFKKASDTELSKALEYWQNKQREARINLHSIQDTVQEIRNEQNRRFLKQMESEQ